LLSSFCRVEDRHDVKPVRRRRVPVRVCAETYRELTRALFVGLNRNGKGKRGIVAKAGILWLLGVPVVVIILLALFTNVI
jgi:hypothetical protein